MKMQGNIPIDTETTSMSSRQIYPEKWNMDNLLLLDVKLFKVRTCHLSIYRTCQFTFRDRPFNLKWGGGSGFFRRKISVSKFDEKK